MDLLPALAEEDARLPGLTRAAGNEPWQLQRILDLFQGKFPISYQKDSKTWPYKTSFFMSFFPPLLVLTLRGGFFKSQELVIKNHQIPETCRADRSILVPTQSSGDLLGVQSSSALGSHGQNSLSSVLLPTVAPLSSHGPCLLSLNTCVRMIWSLLHHDGQEMGKRWIYQVKGSGRLQVEKFPLGPGFSAPTWSRRDPLGTSPLHDAKGSNVARADACWCAQGCLDPPF